MSGVGFAAPDRNIFGYDQLGIYPPFCVSTNQLWRCGKNTHFELELRGYHPRNYCDDCKAARRLEIGSQIARDLKARQARRRALKPLLADLLCKHKANRTEINAAVLKFVGFDLPQ